MEMKRIDLLEKLKRISAGLGDSTLTLKGADSIYIDEKGLHSYNDTISVTVPCEMAGIKGAVNGSRFINLLASYKGENLTLENTEKGLKIKCGRNRANLVWIEDINIPNFIEKLHSVEATEVLPDDFQTAMGLCNLGKTNSNYAGAFVINGIMMATDSDRFSCYEFAKWESEQNKFWISQNNLLELNKIGEKLNTFTTYSKDINDEVTQGEWIHFQTEAGTIFSCTLLDISDLETILPNLEDLRETKKESIESDNLIQGCLPKGFSTALKAVGTMSSKSEIEMKNYVNLTFDSKSLLISSESDYGSSSEEIEWEAPLDIETPVTYSYLVDFLSSIANKFSNFWLDKHEVEGVIYYTLVFESDKFKHIVSSIN